MKIKVWGCRGSIPTPGPDTIRYGGESTCIEILTDKKERLIIDAGSGIKKLGQELLQDKTLTKITLLLTHSHWDHLAGFPFFIPAYLSKYTITVCGGPKAQDTVMNSLIHQMEPPYFPVDFTAMKATFKKGCHCDFEYCDHNLPDIDSSCFSCYSIPLNHPDSGYGFKFINNGKAFVFLTDNELRFLHGGGLPREAYVDFCKNADLLFHDAQYTEEEYKKTVSWGHSTYIDTLELAMEAGVKRLGLFHHDPDRTDNQLDHQVEWCRSYIEKSEYPLECFACAEGMVLEV